MKKELSLGQPILKCYQKGRMMTMMLSQNKNALPWIYYNNMQICCHTLNEKRENFVMDICNAVAPFITKEWDVCPYIRDNSYTIERILDSYSRITDYIKKCLDNEEYVYCCLNTKYIGAYNKNVYKNNVMHDIFICGYNDNMTFICYDYFDDDYIKCNIPFDEIENAIKNTSECINIEDYVNGIHSFLLQNPSHFSFFTANDINREHILQKLFEIITPTYSEARNLMVKRMNGKQIHAFGLDVYEKYANYIQNDNNLDVFYDYRPFYVIKDHITIINDVIKHFDMPFAEKSNALYDMSNQLTVIALKERIKPLERGREKVSKKIMDIKIMEEELINSILIYYRYVESMNK